MTRLLFSVINAVEAAQIKAFADVVDVKDPSKGPLGAPDVRVVAAALNEVGGAAPVSASLGDAGFTAIAGQIELAKSFADEGVSMVKIASCLSPVGTEHVIKKIRDALPRRVKIVATAYADKSPPESLLGFVDIANRSGADGVLLDTSVKNGRTLFDHVDEDTLGAIVSAGRATGIFVALAGSLGFGDLARVARVNPDYAGFRSAISSNGRAAPGVDIAKALEIKNRLRIIAVPAGA